MLFFPLTVPETIDKGNTQNFHLIMFRRKRPKKDEIKCVINISVKCKRLRCCGRAVLSWLIWLLNGCVF